VAAGRAPYAWLSATAALTLGSMAAAVALAPPATAAPGRALAWLLFTGSSVHVAATGWLFTVPEVRAHAGRHRVRYLWLPAALILTAAVAAAVFPPGLAGWLLLPYFCWQFFHYQKQNLGMAALAAAGTGVPPLRAIERRALLGTGLAGIAGLIARPGLLQLRAGPGLPPLLPLAAAGFAISAAAGLAALARRPAAGRPAGFCVLYLVSLLFPLPVFVFGSPYAAVGGMTAAHGLQYLLLVGLVAGGGQGRLTSLAVLANIALAGGAVLAWAAHLHNAGPAGRLLFGAYLGVVMAHFVIDAGFWRLRAEFPRAFLTSRLPYLLAAAPPGTAPPVTAPGAAIPAADLSSTDIGWRP
jgi:hypothetical protein